MSGFLTGARQAKMQQHAQLLRRLGGIPEPTPQADEPAPAATGFDGGARHGQPPATPSHGQLLLGLIRSRSADAGTDF